jgi:hypothetical protein
MRFEQAYRGWQARRLTQEEAARGWGVCERTFRCSLDRYEEAGRADRPALGAPLAPTGPARRGTGATAAGPQAGTSSPLIAGLGARAGRAARGGGRAGGRRRGGGKGKHRQPRARSPWPGLRLHPEASPHPGGAGQRGDWGVTRDEAHHTHDCRCFGEEDGTASRFRGGREVIEQKGLCSALDPERGSHDWPRGGRPGGQGQPDPLGACHEAVGDRDDGGLCAPGPGAGASGPHERRPHRAGADVYRPAFNAEVRQEAREAGSALVAFLGGAGEDMLGERFERPGGPEPGIRFEG